LCRYGFMFIGNLKLKNRIFLAPMAGITDLPYRLLMKQFGAGLVFTEMVSAKGLIHAGKRTRDLLLSRPEESPLGIQLFGSDPESLAEATRMVSDDGALIDLNLGCPVNKVIKDGSGSALMRDPDRVKRILTAVRSATSLPLTIKIRSGWDNDNRNFLEIGKIAEAAGVDAITLHPRTRAQSFSGKADWQQIRQLKETLGIPVIGSGDIFTAEDADNMIRQTGCDAIMIGRGGYGNPWLIRDANKIVCRNGMPDPPSRQERRQVALEHQRLQIELFGEQKALFEMRKHLCWYARGLAGAASFRASINRADTIAEQQELINHFFHPDALTETDEH